MPAGEHDDSRPVICDVSAPANGRSTHCTLGFLHVLDSKVDAKDRRHSSRVARTDESNRAVKTVAIGEREHRLAMGGGSFDECCRR